MNKPILSILAAKRLAFAFCSKQEKRDVENINAELKALYIHLKEDVKYRASKASEYTKDKAQEIKEHIQEKGVAAQEFTIERWDAFSRKLDAWKQRRGESNKSLFSELNEEFRLLHAD